MANNHETVDPDFIKRQKRRLLGIRAELIAAVRSNTLEEQGLSSPDREAVEAEEDAQKLALLELEGQLTARDTIRLQRINRALQKIEEGSYGLSDESGARIPRERLEVVPEAIFTVKEEELNNRGR